MGESTELPGRYYSYQPVENLPVQKSSGVYKQWTELLEWWNSGMVDWIVSTFVFTIDGCVNRILSDMVCTLLIFIKFWVVVMYRNNGMLYGDTKYRNSSHKVLP